MTDTDNSGQQMLCNLDLRRKDATECRQIRDSECNLVRVVLFEI
jgi:hypothetical protein